MDETIAEAALRLWRVMEQRKKQKRAGRLMPAGIHEIGIGRVPGRAVGASEMERAWALRPANDAGVPSRVLNGRGVAANDNAWHAHAPDEDVIPKIALVTRSGEEF